MKKTLVFSAVLLCILVGYFIWQHLGRNLPNELDFAYPEEITSYGMNSGHGNLLAVQPYLIPINYASEDRFYFAIDTYLSIALKKGWLTPKTIIILPEYTGTWLVTAGEKEEVYNAPTISKAMQTIVLSHLFSILKELPFASVKANDMIKYSLFKVKARTAALIYQNVFSKLAKKYGVTIVAGSMVLPSPQINGGRLITGNGKLYNVSVVYKPNGQAYDDLVRKTYLTSTELSFTTNGSPTDLPVFKTPAGRLGVLICADAWYPTAYETLRKKKVEIIAVPSFKTLAKGLDKPWGGYDANPAPDDVNAADINKISEEDALLKYALAGRINSSEAQYGVNVFLRGKFWDIGSDGYTFLVAHGKVTKGKRVGGAALLNYWLP